MIPYIRGKVAVTITEQAHVGIPEGLCEEEFGRNGFFGDYAHLYRKQPPVGWTSIEGPLKPRSYDFNKIKITRDFLAARKPILFNSDCQIHFFTLNTKMDYFFRNAD